MNALSSPLFLAYFSVTQDSFSFPETAAQVQQPKKLLRDNLASILFPLFGNSVISQTHAVYGVSFSSSLHTSQDWYVLCDWKVKLSILYGQRGGME